MQYNIYDGVVIFAHIGNFDPIDVTFSNVSILTSSPLASTLATIGVLVLISLLVLKELISVTADSRLQRMSRALNMGIYPLLMAFFVIVIFEIINVLN